MADGDTVYVFQANGDACDSCSAMDGQEASDLPHEGCNCQIVPKDGKEVTYMYSELISRRTGDGPKDYVFGTEIEVECCDGSTVGASFEIDGHDLPDFAEDGYMDAILEMLDAEASDLAMQCPECEDDFPSV
jgi:hypothetical protein